MNVKKRCIMKLRKSQSSWKLGSATAVPFLIIGLVLSSALSAAAAEIDQELLTPEENERAAVCLHVKGIILDEGLIGMKPEREMFVYKCTTYGAAEGAEDVAKNISDFEKIADEMIRERLYQNREENILGLHPSIKWAVFEALEVRRTRLTTKSWEISFLNEQDQIRERQKIIDAIDYLQGDDMDSRENADRELVAYWDGLLEEDGKYLQGLKDFIDRFKSQKEGWVSGSGYERDYRPLSKIVEDGRQAEARLKAFSSNMEKERLKAYTSSLDNDCEAHPTERVSYELTGGKKIERELYVPKTGYHPVKQCDRLYRLVNEDGLREYFGTERDKYKAELARLAEEYEKNLQFWTEEARILGIQTYPIVHPEFYVARHRPASGYSPRP